MAATADGGDGGPLEPTALRYVGPATAAVIERGPFDAADIAAARVSHRALVEAGVNPGVAERLRREYGLLWAFRWHPGDVDLRRRAAALRGAGAAERRWIELSGGDWQAHDPAADGAGADPDPPPADLDGEWAAWPEVDGDDAAPAALAAAFDDAGDSVCPRCGGELTRYTLGDRESVLCDDCGYAGVPVTHGDDAWRTAVDRIFRGQTA